MQSWTAHAFEMGVPTIESKQMLDVHPAQAGGGTDADHK